MTKKKFMHRFLCVIAVCFVSVLAFLGFVPASVGVISYAEEESVQSDINDVKSANLIDFSKYIPQTGDFSITCPNPFDNGTLNFNGRIQEDYKGIVYIPLSNIVEDKKTYTCSQSMFFENTLHAIYLQVYCYSVVDSSYNFLGYCIGSNSVTFSVDLTNYKNYMLSIHYGRPVGYDIVDYTISFMFNEGDVALSYQPNLQGLYETSYNQGYQDGISSSVLGPFDGVTVQSYAVVNGVSSEVYTSTPINQNNVVSLNYLYNYYSNLYANATSLNAIVISFIFARPYLATELRLYGFADYPLFAFGEEDVENDFIANFDGGGDIAVSFLYDELRDVYSLRFNASTVPERDVVSLTGWTFEHLDGLKNLRFTMSGNNYYAGYLAGKADGMKDANDMLYNDGFSAGVDSGYRDGYNVGYSDGDTQGYIRGLETAEDGSLVSLIGVMFDAPLNGSLKLLSFDILGVNMLGFFMGLLTLMFIVKVLGLLLRR